MPQTGSRRERQGRKGSSRRTRRPKTGNPGAADPQHRTRREAPRAFTAEQLRRRRTLVPRIAYPQQLPVSQRRDDLAAAIRDNQVVVVAGETGSGKTTQLPKICLELGRGVTRRIGHTQPRRIAARTVAERVAEEVGSELGGVVGYQVRFSDHSGPDTLVKVMTDGILLAELQHDRMLSAYDTIILDEVHERSLNIDFLLGYLKRLLPARPDLKVVLASATIEPERFSRHFADEHGVPAPVVEVSGRTFPVQVRYRPLADDSYQDEDGEPVVRDQTEAIVDAVRELVAEGPGDILVFLPGEREIRDTADVLAKLRPVRALDRFEVLPLYARLSGAEQRRVFEPHAVRRVVLATNVAETSLTVPGVRYVVDTGFARISRYSSRTKVQRLPLEAISQASADQRKGRCGRVEAGVCIRLYSEQDFLSRPRFTDPEILRTNLASVLLRMAALDLGDVAGFPFPDPPDQRHVKAGVQLLVELGALAPRPRADGGAGERRRGDHVLTELGRRLAAFPVDPRLARMVLEADRRGCLREVLVITAALSVQDPRERPLDQQGKADQLHARFRDGTSDFLPLLNLWRYLRERQRSSSSAFRRTCRAEFLNYLRVREWQELEAQLREVAKQLRLDVGELAGEPDEDAIHQALMAGLLSQVGLRDPERGDYLGARNARFSIFPGSGLFRKQPALVMCAELVETTRLWGRVNAAIRPEWAEQLGAHLVKRSYSAPHWSRSRAAVMASERVMLYGVPLVVDRLVPFGRVDPELSRNLFLRHALVYGEWATRHGFLERNRALLEEAEELEHRARRRDIVVDEHTLFDFYDARVGRDVVSGSHFDAWWKQARRREPDLLDFDPQMLLSESAPPVRDRDYPGSWRDNDLVLALSYEFQPGSPTDGVCVDVPVTALNQVDPEAFTWQVPGRREELAVALIRSLPKAMRAKFVPAPDYAKAFLASETPGQEPLSDALARFLRARTGVVVADDDWDWSRVPAHLRPTFRVVDESGGVLGQGKDLGTLQEELAPRFRRALTDAAEAGGLSVSGQRAWTFGPIPRTYTQSRAGQPVLGFPALVDESLSPGGSRTVGVRVLGSEAEQDASMRLGTRRLLTLTVPSPAKTVAGELGNADKLTLAASPYPSVAALLEDCVAAAVDLLVEQHGGPAWDPDAFAALARRVGEGLPAGTRSVLQDTMAALAAWRDTDRALSGSAELALLPALNDMRQQVCALVYRGFVADVGADQLRHLPRYLAAVRTRRDLLSSSPGRDRLRMDRVEQLQQAYRDRVGALPAGRPAGDGLTRVRWMLEEYRVSLWAQQLGTAFPVSEVRIRQTLAEA